MKKKSIKKKVVTHLKDDIKTFKHEAEEDRELIKKIKNRSDRCKKRK